MKKFLFFKRIYGRVKIVELKRDLKKIQKLIGNDMKYQLFKIKNFSMNILWLKMILKILT